MKISIGCDIKSSSSNLTKHIATQIYKKNNFNSIPVNVNNLNNILKSNDLNKTAVSCNSHNSLNFNNNNIIINNKFESDNTKPITNLNMIFQFKTILNDEVNSRKNKIVKIDAKKVIRNSSINKNKNLRIQNLNNNPGNINPNETIFNNYKSHNSILNLLENKNSNIDSHKTINVINNTFKKKNNVDLNNQNKKVLNMNSTLKSGNSISKSKIISAKVNEYNNNFDSLKYSINQLKDFLNQNHNNSKSKKK